MLVNTGLLVKHLGTWVAEFQSNKTARLKYLAAGVTPLNSGQRE